MLTLRTIGHEIVSTLASNARDVSMLPTLDTIFPIFNTCDVGIFVVEVERDRAGQVLGEPMRLGYSECLQGPLRSVGDCNCGGDNLFTMHSDMSACGICVSVGGLEKAYHIIYMML